MSWILPCLLRGSSGVQFNVVVSFFFCIDWATLCLCCCELYWCHSKCNLLYVPTCTISDVKGNLMNLQDAPKHCGYSARKGKDGKIQLSLQLHTRCHMSVQASIDSDFFHTEHMTFCIIEHLLYSLTLG